MPTLPKNQDNSQTDEIIQTHIKRLTDSNFVVRHNAHKELQRLGTEAISALLEEFDKEFQKYTARELLIGKIGKVGLIGGVYLMFLSFLFTKHNDSFLAARFLLVVSSCVIMGSLFARLFGSELPARLRAVYDLLVEMHDPRIFSVLLEMYSANPGWASDNTLKLLAVYLPHINLIQWEGLNQKQRKVLYYLVENRGQIDTKRCFEFTLSALKALEQFGDMEAIPAVQHIAKHGCNHFLRKAARECLPYLEMRRDEASTRKTLLRASQPDNKKGELLRVPTHTQNVESEQLLRMPPPE